MEGAGSAAAAGPAAAPSRAAPPARPAHVHTHTHGTSPTHRGSAGPTDSPLCRLRSPAVLAAAASPRLSLCRSRRHVTPTRERGRGRGAGFPGATPSHVTGSLHGCPRPRPCPRPAPRAGRRRNFQRRCLGSAWCRGCRRGTRARQASRVGWGGVGWGGLDWARPGGWRGGKQTGPLRSTCPSIRGRSDQTLCERLLRTYYVQALYPLLCAS
ncbi:translation initiation factor IF-2-like [Orcinus orca]|uniref:translation initiation factor IF-2-like n=1 Tax=Orcinus orca TaxID=9733 RepID=UPI002110E9F6|nr:translation initiation factor IF-2-like [Orcinus orca]